MNMNQVLQYRSFCLMIVLILISCGNPIKQEKNGVDAIKTLKKNSPEDQAKMENSKSMMNDLYKQLNFIPNTDIFLNVIHRCKDNHLFVNADHQGYILLAVTNKGIQQVPESEAQRLKDTSSFNHAYQLNFLIHHIVNSPRQVYPGMVYTNLAGEDLSISENRSDLTFKNRSYPIKSSFKMSESLEIISIDSVLFR